MRPLLNSAVPTRPAAPARPKPARLAWTKLLNAAAPAVSLATALAALAGACLSLAQNTAPALAIVELVVLSVAQQVLFLYIYLRFAKWDFKVALLALLSFAGLVVLYVMPEYLTGWQFNAVVHRSFFAAVWLMAMAIPAMMCAIYYLAGATPRAEDYAHYPLVLVPVGLALAVYVVLIGQLVLQGLPNLTWQAISKPYFSYGWPIKVFVGGDWPMWSSELRTSIGLLYYLQGTGLLMLLTAVISLPIGVGAGLYLSEYATGILGSLTRFAVTALRAISLLILGLTAFSLTDLSSGTPLASLLHGRYFDGFVWQTSSGGSFLAASIVLSFLVIPLIALATEEGCRSLPPELREGSLALGASDETTLWRIVLPWSLPNVVTALLLGCAEAAGSVAVLMFIAGRGDYGVGPFSQVTSLAYAIFIIWFGDQQFKGSMGPFLFTAGVLLMIITMGMGIAAMLTKRWLVRRHRGG